jgi:hypothetical protein
VSFGAIGLMIIVGVLAARSEALRGFSVTVRTALALAIVFLMTTTPGVVTSLVAVGIALAGSPLVALVVRPRDAKSEHRRGPAVVHNARS